MCRKQGNVNILYDYQIFSRQTCGGISRYFFELITHRIKEEDSNVSLFQGLHINMFDMKPYARHFDHYFGIRHRRIPGTNVLLPEMNRLLFAMWLRTTKVDADIYHPTYYNHIDLCEHKNCKTVATVYDMIHARMATSRKDSTVRMMRKCVAKADRIIAISESTKRDVMEYMDIPESRITVIYLAADHICGGIAKEEDSDAFLGRYDIGKPFILYVGDRVGHKGYKNFTTLLSAFSSWDKKNEFNLICIGGETQWSPVHADIMRSAHITESVMLIRNVTNDALRDFYSQAYAYVIPSLYEGFGVPPLEAMTCNVPVIAANTSSIPEVVGDAGMYFDPLSSEELTTCLDTIVGNSELRESLKRRGLRQSKRFSWKQTATKTYELYKHLA